MNYVMCGIDCCSCGMNYMILSVGFDVMYYVVMSVVYVVVIMCQVSRHFRCSM